MLGELVLMVSVTLTNPASIAEDERVMSITDVKYEKSLTGTRKGIRVNNKQIKLDVIMGSRKGIRI